MISIDRLKEMALEDIENNPEKHLEEYTELLQQLDQLKTENEELKKKCNIYTCGICGNKEDCNKLYKTLAEIKEIVEQGVKIHDDIIVSKQIVQKISEVIPNEN